MTPPPTSNPPPRPPFLHASSNWKSKSSKHRPRKRNPNIADPCVVAKKSKINASWSSDLGHGQVYQPPRLKDLQFQNKIKASRFFPKRYARRGSDFPFGAAPASFVENRTSGFGTSRPFHAPWGFSGEATASGFTVDGKASSLNATASRSHGFQGKCLETEALLHHSAMVGSGKSVIQQSGPKFAANTETCMVPGPALTTGGLDFALTSNAKSDLVATCQRDVKPSMNCPLAPRHPDKITQQYRRRRVFRHPKRNGSEANRGAPSAPRNTTSFLMRAKKSGGITSLISPSPTTPAIIPTPVRSPFPPFTGLADEANQEWGVNGYGSMNGLIRLRSSELEREEAGDNDTESEVEQGAQSAQQLEERLDHDVSRFVMTYPSNNSQNIGQNILEIRMDDQDSHIAHLEEENMDLKERLHLMQREVEDLRRRMQVLEGVGNSHEDEGSTGRSLADDASCL